MSVFFAIDASGRRRPVKAQALEVMLPDGQSVRLSIGEGAEDEICVRASAAGKSAVMCMQPVSASMVTLRVMAGSPREPDRHGMLTLSVQKVLRKRDTTDVPKRREIQRWASAALERDAEVTVRIVDAVEGRALNKAYRGKDYATNVLTFTYDEADGMSHLEGMPLVGDLVLCAPVVAAEAAAQGKPLDAHYAHLVVHGILHLQAYDHENDDEAERMEAREREILANLGYPDPYAGEKDT